MTAPDAPARPPRAKFATVELAPEELGELLLFTQSQFAELERVLAELDDEEGESMTQWNLKRTLKPRRETLGDLSMKLEAAAREAGWR